MISMTQAGWIWGGVGEGDTDSNYRESPVSLLWLSNIGCRLYAIELVRMNIDICHWKSNYRFVKCNCSFHHTDANYIITWKRTGSEIIDICYCIALLSYSGTIYFYYSGTIYFYDYSSSIYSWNYSGTIYLYDYSSSIYSWNYSGTIYLSDYL